MDKIIVSTVGILVIGFIYWFFFAKKESGVVSSGVVEIRVEGGYKPTVVRVKKGVSTKLTFIRSDPNPCLEEVVFPDFKIKKYLPLNKEVEVDITPHKVGRYQFHCGMNMFFGSLIVES